MSLDLPGRKSREHGSRIRPSFSNRNWQDGPVVRTGRGPQPDSSRVIVTDCLTGTSVSAGKRCKTAPSLADIFHHKPAQTGTLGQDTQGGLGFLDAPSSIPADVPCDSLVKT
jgi:hypothetical protein